MYWKFLANWKPLGSKYDYSTAETWRSCYGMALATRQDEKPSNHQRPLSDC